MADMFLVIDGIEGEAMDDKFRGRIEIMNWSWSMKNPAKWAMTMQERRSKVEVDPITVEKNYDKASVTLVEYCTMGKQIDKATIVCRKNDGEDKVNFLLIEMFEVMVNNITWKGGGWDQSPEQIILSFAKFRTFYTPQLNSGDGGVPAKTDFGFDIGQHKAL